MPAKEKTATLLKETSANVEVVPVRGFLRSKALEVRRHEGLARGSRSPCRLVAPFVSVIGALNPGGFCSSSLQGF